MSVPLERILYGPSASGTPAFGVSEGVTVQEALLWRGLASIDPLEAGDAYGLFTGPDDTSAFVRASRTGSGSPIWAFLLAPRRVLEALAGDFTPLHALAQSALPGDLVPPHIDRTVLQNPTPWPADQRQAVVERFLAARGGADDLWSLLGMALQERGVMIYGAPLGDSDRLQIVQAISALVPPSARPLLTFTTNRAAEMPSNARIAFGGREVTTGRWVAEWDLPGRLPTGAQAAPYVALLQTLWTGSVDALLDAVESMEPIARRFADGRPVSALLTAIAERCSLDRRVTQGEPVAPEALRQAMREMSPSGELGQQYYARLLDHAMDARDTDSAVLVARAMDADPALDAALSQRLEAMLTEQPDAVYAFVRARVASGDQASGRWLERLAEAASAALSIAIADGDAEIVRSWIRLLAREPLSYGLTPALTHGLFEAAPLARSNPDLARSMLVVAAKRDPAALDPLLNDREFQASLPPGLRDLLFGSPSESFQTALSYGVELVLAGLSRAADQRRPELFSPEAIDLLWNLAFGSQAVQVAEPISAQKTLGRLVADPSWLSADGLTALLGEVLRARRDDLFQKSIHALSAAPDWPERSEQVLADALIASDRSGGEIVALLGTLVSAGLISEPAALAVSVALLDERGWNVDLLPLASQTARGAQRNLPIHPNVLWRLLDLGRAARDEAITRDSARRMTANLEAQADDAEFAASFGRLVEAVRWNGPTTTWVLGWWRTFARALPTARLARFDKSFEGQRELDEARATAGTLLAFRRMLGKRSLAQFAGDVAAALAMLQSLDEAYEPAARREAGFDAEVMRAELEAQGAALKPAEAHLLANNLAALAQLIGELGDARTRQALLRREDADQLLTHGEADPHGGVDTLKWISGYFAGTHHDEDKP